MAIKFSEAFDVDAPLEHVWAYVSDPTVVVVALPGAELTGQKDDGTYEGRFKAKVGPITASYKGLARIESKDDAAHEIRLVGDGREATGTGTAKAKVVGRVSPSSSGKVAVSVEAEVDIKGKLATLGGGLILEVARQIFRQASERIRSDLETAAAAARPAPASAESPEAASVAAASATDPPGPASRARQVHVAAASPARELNVLSVLASAFAALFGRLFRRISGRAAS